MWDSVSAVSQKGRLWLRVFVLAVSVFKPGKIEEEEENHTQQTTAVPAGCY